MVADKISHAISKILLVLDDEKLVEVLTSQLSQYFELALASDCRAGVTQAKIFLPDCILSDARLPRKALVQMLEKIRSISRLTGVGVVLFTGREPERYQPRDHEGLVDLYIAQPYLVEELIASLTGMTRMHRRGLIPK